MSTAAMLLPKRSQTACISCATGSRFLRPWRILNIMPRPSSVILRVGNDMQKFNKCVSVESTSVAYLT